MRLRPLKAHPVSIPVLGHRSGRWYLGPLHVMNASSYIVQQDVLVAQPFLVPRRHTYDRIAINVTGPEPGKSLRLGIYQHDGDAAAPGGLLLDAGAVSIDVDGKRELAISQSLDAGWWWLAMLSDATGTGRLVASGTVGGDPMLGYDDVDNTSFHRFVSRAQSFGPLPDPFGTVTDYNTGGVTPRVWLRA